MKVTWYSKGSTRSSLSKVKSYFSRHKHDYDGLTASKWIRCLQVIPYLEKFNIECCVDDGSSLDTDVAVITRWQDARAYELIKKLRQENVKIIFDVCVNYFDGPVTFPRGHGVSKVQVDEIRKITPIVDVVTCASRYIQERANELNSNAIYIPDSVDLNHFKFRKKKGEYFRGVPMAIWAGNAVKVGEVVDLYPLLKQRGISLTVISNKRISMPGPYQYIPWSYSSFPENIIKGDFCISPRRIDNTYDVGHSHFKIGVFMSQGVPALCANLPSYEELIQKTNGGLICESELDWVNALDNILEDRESLWKWSQGAFKGMRSYSTEVIARSYANIFETLLSGGINGSG